jgi:transcriptional regulator with XRE-family HTH domain
VKEMVKITFQDKKKIRHNLTEKIKQIPLICAKWRMKNGLTVKQISDMLGYSIPHIYKFEEGRTISEELIYGYALLGAYEDIRKCLFYDKN